MSVSFGSQALFRWKGKSCLDGEVNSCWLGHGDILFVDGQCQDEFLHCTDPGLELERVNVTFCWIRQHTLSWPLRAGVVYCLPTCAKGLSASVMENWEVRTFLFFFGAPWSLVCMGDASSAGTLPHIPRAWVRCAFRWTCLFGGCRRGHIYVTLGEFPGSHKQVLICFNGGIVNLVK